MRTSRPEHVDADRAPPPSSVAEAEVGRIVAEVTALRDAGEDVSDAETLARHPHLLPALADELRAAARAKAALLQGRRAGPIDRPIRALTFEELDAPLEFDAGSSDGAGLIAAGGGGAQAAQRRAFPIIEGYRVLNELGDGGQATVYRAVQEVTGRAVAVKVILGGAFGTSRSRARLDAEAAALASIDHPHVVRIVDRGRARDGSPFIAMDLIDGLPLDEYVERIRPTLPDLIRLWAKVARGVEAAHRHGIVHRDLKPANVLVDARGDPHVMDFGLAHRDATTGADGGPLGARALSRTLTGQIVGSLPWSSPEQVGALPGCAVDARSDVYSLAVLAYQSLTGDWPYDVTGPVHTVLYNIAEGRPVALGRTRRRWRVATEPAIAPALAAALDAVMAKALAKAPAARHQTADELATALESLVDPATSGTAMARRYLRRQVVRACGAVAIAVVVCALGVVGVTAVTAAWRSHAHPHLRAIYEAGPPNQFGMRFVRLPSATFFMGSPPREAGRADDERRHAVRLTRPFEIATTEVTRGQYTAVMGALPEGAAGGGTPDQPVAGVTWDEANTFCRRLSERVGRTCRLPTEAEWEYACRGGSDAAFANGGDDLDDMGWSAERAGGVRHPVAAWPPNAFGLYDMHGGVAEWCQDFYNADYPPTGDGASSDPLGRPLIGVRQLIVRGGSDHDPASHCRSAARAFAAPDSRSDRIGFRVVMDAQADNTQR